MFEKRVENIKTTWTIQKFNNCLFFFVIVNNTFLESYI